ncbi:hypothetical protein CONCODRAFT_78776 [Conidiobolus coronatus NRRL 28638]|uniref:Uncharacterized protein n=1 Tax=Conidiobolus coronatus (strain ATCC 28846 / CBS 209.66 / NRRL 28638) TaxID=796925 RepID=A0A137P6F2_CONC2|nr:hypothetical protein CONCODRAFT_78776 [Conidiobolus coronatus NRRL 28638]|eukprot:KXN70600.1 hypothetical protein CONCODRAFT_78776 [Conidiobolus coronatus NRRL 28638]
MSVQFEFELNNPRTHQLIIEVQDLFIYFSYYYPNNSQFKLDLYQFNIHEESSIFDKLKVILNSQNSICIKILNSFQGSFYEQVSSWITSNFPNVQLIERKFDVSNIKLGLTFIQNELKYDTFPDKFMLVTIDNSINFYNISIANDSAQLVFTNEISPETIIAIASMHEKNLNFEQFIQDSKNGNKDNLDLLVRDIFGESSTTAKLHGHITAASFGKVNNIKNKSSLKLEDIGSSLIFIQCINLSQLAVLNSNLYDIKSIVYSGWFANKFSYIANMIEIGTTFWSASTMQARVIPITQWVQSLGLLNEE